MSDYSCDIEFILSKRNPWGLIARCKTCDAYIGEWAIYSSLSASTVLLAMQEHMSEVRPTRAEVLDQTADLLEDVGWGPEIWQKKR